MTVHLHASKRTPFGCQPGSGERPMFPSGSRFAVARDVGILAVCIAIVVGFLVQVWSAPVPRSATAPATLLASTALLR